MAAEAEAVAAAKVAATQAIAEAAAKVATDTATRLAAEEAGATEAVTEAEIAAEVADAAAKAQEVAAFAEVDKAKHETLEALEVATANAAAKTEAEAAVAAASVKKRKRKIKRPRRPKLPEEALVASPPSHIRHRTPNFPKTLTTGSSLKVASRRNPVCRAARPSWRNIPRMRRTQRRPRRPTPERVQRATPSLKHDDNHKTPGAR